MRFHRFALLLIVQTTALSSVSTRAEEATWPDLANPPPASRAREKDAAVIVGVERYAYLPPIPGATRNARDWYVYLTKTRGIPVGQVRLVQDADATREQLEQFATDAAKQVLPGGTLWFVFIGHGAPAINGKDGLLVGADTQQTASSLGARGLPERRLLDLLETGEQGHTVVVLDACFSGRNSSGESLVKGLQPLVVVSDESRAGRSGRTLLLTAARSDQFAGPLPGLARPAFSYLVLGGLRGWADHDGDGRVTAGELRDYSSQTLQALLTDRRQTPELAVGDPDQTLAVNASEAGPDISKMVMAAPGASELVFGGGVEIRVPTITVRSVSGLKDINLEAEQRLETAMDTEENAKARPEQKADAWCNLAEVADNNPYKAKAQVGCDSWKAYAEAQVKLEASIVKDYRTLAGYLALHRKPVAQKQSAVDAFLAAYQEALPRNEYVKEVGLARRALGAGREVQLPGAVLTEEEKHQQEARKQQMKEDERAQEKAARQAEEDNRPRTKASPNRTKGLGLGISGLIVVGTGALLLGLASVEKSAIQNGGFPSSGDIVSAETSIGRYQGFAYIGLIIGGVLLVNGIICLIRGPWSVPELKGATARLSDHGVLRW